LRNIVKKSIDMRAQWINLYLSVPYLGQRDPINFCQFLSKLTLDMTPCTSGVLIAARFGVCKYLLAGNAMETRGEMKGVTEKRGYTLNCSTEIDGVSSLPLERFVCPTCATHTHTHTHVHTCVHMCGCTCMYACATAPRRSSLRWRHQLPKMTISSLILSRITWITFISVDSHFN